MSLLTGLLTLYELNEASGDAIDSVAAANAVLSGSSGAATGKISGCRTLSGSPNRFEGTVVPSAYPISMSCWIRTSDSSATLRDPYVVGNSTTVNRYANLQLNTSGHAVYDIHGSNPDVTCTGSVAVNDGSWHHLVGISRSATDHELYVDGVSAATNSGNAGTFPALDRNTIGALNYGGAYLQYWIGDVDQCGLWSVDITSLVATLYNSGSGLAYSSFGGGGGLVGPLIGKGHLIGGPLVGGRLIRAA